MDLTALKEEIANPEYAQKTDEQIAEMVNAKTVNVSRVVPTWEVKQHAIQNGYWPAIVIAARREDIPVEVRGLAISAKDWIDDQAGKIQTIDLSNPAVQFMVGGLVAATLMTQEQADSLMAMGTKTVSWLSTVGISEVGIGFVRSARVS